MNVSEAAVEGGRVKRDYVARSDKEREGKPAWRVSFRNMLSLDYFDIVHIRDSTYHVFVFFGWLILLKRNGIVYDMVASFDAYVIVHTEQLDYLDALFFRSSNSAWYFCFVVLGKSIPMHIV